MKPFNKADILAAFHSRASTRVYDPKRKISEDDFNAILEFGRLSPSSVGSEPWKFLIIQNNDLRERLTPLCWGIRNMNTVSHLVAILAKRHARYDSEFFANVLTRRGLNEEAKAKALAIYQKFQTQDIAILDNERTLFDWASKQTYIALANMMTGAAMMGIDSCPIEGFAHDEVNELLAKTKAFDPQEWRISVMCTFGYRAQEIPPKLRQPINDIVTILK